MSAYYNENDPKTAAWLRELIRCGHIAKGEVDERSIVDIQPDDLRGFTQCHFFAGIGGWSYALRLAGWPDDRPVWTGSCPCQPFSAAGKGDEFADERHLWPAWFRLVRECRPIAIFGEQVASKDAFAWLDHVSTDLESEGYAFGAVDTCAAGFGAPHIRQRLYFVADTNGKQEHATAEGRFYADTCERGNLGNAQGRGFGIERDEAQPGSCGHANGAEQPSSVAKSKSNGREGREFRELQSATEWKHQPVSGPSATNGFWSSVEWIACRDGKARPTQSRLIALVTRSAGGMGSGCDSGDTDETEGEINGQVHSFIPKISSDGETSVRSVRDGQAQAARSPQGREPAEQRGIKFADFVRLLPSARALAELSGDVHTAETVSALLQGVGEAWSVQHASDSGEAIWRSLGEESQERVRMGFDSGRWMRDSVFPLVTGAPARVVRLRGYGNTIVSQVAKEFIEAYLDIAIELNAKSELKALLAGRENVE